MSTLDPGLEPPGDWQSPYSPPPTNGRNRETDRAAVYVWLCAGVGFLMTCCCTLNAVAMILDPQTLIEQFPMELPPELKEMDLPQLVVGMSVVLLILYVVMLLVPSAALTLLGFGVRNGRPGQTTAAKWLTFYFVVLAGIGVVLGLASMASTGVNTVALVQLLIFGGWLWLTLTTFSALRGLSGPSDLGEPNDPWGR